MVWTHSAYPSLKSRGQQLTKDGEKENYKNLSLLFRGYKHQQLKGEVSSLKYSLFRDYRGILREETLKLLPARTHIASQLQRTIE